MRTVSHANRENGGVMAFVPRNVASKLLRWEFGESGAAAGAPGLSVERRS